MQTRARISAYIWFLVLSVVAFAASVIVFEMNQDRIENRFEDRLTNYHRSSILALSALESDLLRFHSAAHSSSIGSSQHGADFDTHEFRSLLDNEMSAIVRIQAQFGSPVFAHAVSNLTDSHANLDELLAMRPSDEEHESILSAAEWRAFQTRVLQLQRLHSAESEGVTTELRETRADSLRKTLLFSIVISAVGFVVVLRMIALIRAVMLDHYRSGLALKESQDHTQAILDGAAEAIISIDEGGVVEAFNKAAEDTFGYSAGEVVGRNIAMLMPEPHHSSHDRYLRDYLRTGRKHIIGTTREMEGRRKDGTTFPLELSISELQLKGRRLFTGILLDISERRQLEEQLRQSQKMDAIGRLAGGVAHDFNNILTVILGYASVMRDLDGLHEEVHADLNEIEDAAGRAQELTRQLLAFSRKQVLQPRPVKLNDIVHDAAKMLDRLIGEHIALVLSLESSLGLIEADPSQVEQVIVNLSLNARDAMNEGGVLNIETSRVTLGGSSAPRVPDAEPGAYCVLTISDTGEGIDAAHHDRLFEPFFTTKEAGKGTGLGLSTVYGIVQQSDAHISFESEVGKGTTFNIYFRILDAPAETGALDNDERTERPTAGTETVLVVEDEEIVRKLVVRVLSDNGYEVVETSSSSEALALFRERRGEIDLVVTDVIMPESSGAHLADQLTELRGDVPVLFMSGYTADEIGHHGVLEAGVNFIQKPFSPSHFAEHVRRVLDAGKGREYSPQFGKRAERSA